MDAHAVILLPIVRRLLKDKMEKLPKDHPQRQTSRILWSRYFRKAFNGEEALSDAIARLSADLINDQDLATRVKEYDRAYGLPLLKVKW